jgi:hypothetical protein
MSRPVLFVIDDDAGVVHALQEDLSRRFGEDFRVIGESSAGAGLAMLRKLADEHEPVALLIVDHDLSEMPGTPRARVPRCRARRRTLADFPEVTRGRWAAAPLPTVLQAAGQELGQVGAGDVGELVELGAAGEPVGQHHRVLGVVHRGQQGGLGDGP